MLRRRLPTGLRRTTSTKSQSWALSPVFRLLLAGVWVTPAPSCRVHFKSISEGSGDAPSKIKALRAAGIVVSESAGHIGKHMLEEMKRHKLA